MEKQKRDWTAEEALSLTKEIIPAFGDAVKMLMDSAVTGKPIDAADPELIKLVLLITKMARVPKDFNAPGETEAAAARARAQREESKPL